MRQVSNHPQAARLSATWRFRVFDSGCRDNGISYNRAGKHDNTTLQTLDANFGASAHLRPPDWAWSRHSGACPAGKSKLGQSGIQGGNNTVGHRNRGSVHHRMIPPQLISPGSGNRSCRSGHPATAGENQNGPQKAQRNERRPPPHRVRKPVF